MVSKCPVQFVFMLSILVYVYASERPHIILIVADDLGWNDVSFHGSRQIPTPNIDKLAYDGIILNNYYVSPICTPTRGALMTGRHPIHTGLQHAVIGGAQPYGLPLNETIMPQYLKKLGYRTHVIGKWHLGFFQKAYEPLNRGFETHYGYYQGRGDFFDHTYEAAPGWFGFDFRRNGSLDYSGIGQYSTELYNDEALKVINKHNTSQPLFLYLAHQAVHTGNEPDGKALQAPDKYLKRFPHIRNGQRKLFAGMTSALDDSVGHVINALKAKGMYNNSIIVFTTDNGGPANGFDGNAANNFPLRGVKVTLWEGGVRGVGLIHSPLLKTKRYVAEQLMHVCDWMPTLYRAAGGDPKILNNSDGFDLWDMLSYNGKPVRNELLHNIDPIEKKAAIRVGDYKLLIGGIRMDYDGWYPPWHLAKDSKRFHIDNMNVKNLNFDNFLNNTDARYSNSLSKYKPSSGTPVKVDCGPKPADASTNCKPEKAICLFHIPTDPCEYNNIADQNEDIVNQILVKLNGYYNTMVPPLNKPDDPAGNPKVHNGAWVPWM